MTKRSLAAALAVGGRTGAGVEEAAIEAREARVGSLPALSILHVADKVVQSQEPCLLVVRIGIPARTRSTAIPIRGECPE